MTVLKNSEVAEWLYENWSHRNKEKVQRSAWKWTFSVHSKLINNHFTAGHDYTTIDIDLVCIYNKLSISEKLMVMK